MPKKKQSGAPESKPKPKESAVQLIQTVRRQTKTRYSAEDKIRIILEGLRGDHPVAELCRREGISGNVYYVWLKEFMEAGTDRSCFPRGLRSGAGGLPAVVQLRALP